MPVRLTDRFDEALAPYMRDCLNDLALELVLCSFMIVGEGDYSAGHYTPVVGIPPVAVGNWSSPDYDNHFMFTVTGEIEIHNPTAEAVSDITAFILREPGGDGSAYAFASLSGEYSIPAGGRIWMKLRMHLSDKDTSTVAP